MLNLAPWPPYACNSSFLACWPHPRPRHQVLGVPAKPSPRLVEALCPTRSPLTSEQIASLTWQDVKGLCNA